MSEPQPIPMYFAVRTTLTDTVAMFEDLMPNHSCVDIGETMRLMIADYFYGDQIPTSYQTIKMFDRVLVLGYNMFPPMESQKEMMEIAGDIFWALADHIRRSVLMVYEDSNSAVEYRPTDCFYVFDSATMELMVYLPYQGFEITGAAKLDGRAVLATCRSTWPKFLTEKLQSPIPPNPGLEDLVKPEEVTKGKYGGANF